MSDYNRGYARPVPTDRADMSVDAGLRAFMLGVYNKLALGLLVAAGLAWLTSQYSPLGALFYQLTPDGRLAGFTVLGMAVRFAPIAILLVSMFAMRNPSPRASGFLYWAIVLSIGAGLGLWLIVYEISSIFQTFLITATAFGGLSLVGYTTKKDLTGFGSFLIMGVIGLLIASVVNMFLQNGAMAFIVNVLGVLIFAGLIAYDTQRLKMTYYELGGNQAAMSVATNYGALSLFINFINLFQFLLALFGNRR